jgi:hypothetical protein
VYEALSEGVAQDDALLALLLDTPDQQRRPSLLFAAVNLLVAAHPDARLAAYYPIHGGNRGVDDATLPAFSAFVAQHRDALLRLLRERSTQTNEIRRCVALRLALGHVHDRWPGPLALVEVGASAGLNLLFDRYQYRLGAPGESAAAPGDVVVDCEVLGTPRAGLLGVAPAITRRFGVDHNPVDLSDPDARAWLEAFVWPEQTRELATLRGAVDLVRATGDASVVAGDALADTARMIAGLPGGEPVVVFTASLLSYLPAEGRAAFAAQLTRAAAHRPVAWVCAEGPGLIATTGLRVPALEGPLAGRNSLYAVGAFLFPGPNGHTPEDAGADGRLLALADPYLTWLAPARDPADDFSWVRDSPAGA